MKSSNLLINLLVVLFITQIVVACGGGGGGGSDDSTEPDGQNPPSEFDKVGLVTHLTNNVITPRIENFNSKAGTLLTAVNTYCDSEEAFNVTPNEQNETARDNDRESAQSSWREAMADWQVIEVMQLGPLLEQDGQLRNRIYSWPVVSSCSVDEDVTYFKANEVPPSGAEYNIATRSVNRRGLDALEYLLFNSSLDQACTGSQVIEGWDSLSDADKREQRCRFAAEVASDIANNAQNLVDDWSGPDGYAQSLINADTAAGSDFENIDEAINRISDGLFYIDTVTKDEKLAVPLAIANNSCNGSICIDDLESQFAENSLANIRNNLVSLRDLFTGEVENQSETIGFDDYLISEDAETLSTDILAAIDAAIADIDAYQDESLKASLDADSSQATATHDSVKAITDQLKADFITELSLTLPSSSAGDND